MLEVIEAIDGPLASDLSLGEGLKESTQSRLRDALNKVTVTSRSQLEAIKLSQLMPPPEAPAED